MQIIQIIKRGSLFSFRFSSTASRRFAKTLDVPAANSSRNEPKRRVSNAFGQVDLEQRRSRELSGSIPDPVSPFSSPSVSRSFSLSPYLAVLLVSIRSRLYPLFLNEPTAVDWLDDPANILRWPRDWPSSSSRQVVSECASERSGWVNEYANGW